MGYYFNPPQPTQGTPHVPIGTQGQQPPLRTLHSLYAVRGTWSEPTWPAQYGPRIAPQTLVYGDQPPRRTLHGFYQTRATWPEPWWSAQSEPDSASYNVAIISQPPAGLAGQINLIRALWLEATWPAQYGAKITPLTLVYGDQPPRFKPTQSVWPQPIWNAQSAAPNAGWNVPAIVLPLIPPALPQWQIWQSWQSTVPPAQSVQKNAAWNVPIVVASTVPPAPPPQWQVWQAWQATPQPVQRISLLVQPSTGAQPPPFTLHARMALRQQWPEASWSAQSAAPSAAWNRPRVDNPPPLPAVKWSIWASWYLPPQPKQAKPVQNIEGIVIELPTRIAFDAATDILRFDTPDDLSFYLAPTDKKRFDA